MDRTAGKRVHRAPSSRPERAIIESCSSDAGLVVETDEHDRTASKEKLVKKIRGPRS